MSLELHLHLTNGNTHKFAQHDAQAAEQILQAMNPRIFTQPSLILFGENSVTTYPTAALVGVSVFMANVTESLLQMTRNLQLGVEDIAQITQADYTARKAELQPLIAGQAAILLQQIEFISGHRLWLEVKVGAAANEVQERQLVKHAFEGPSLVCRCDGGISLWNRAQMVSHSFIPKPQFPLPALPAEPIIGA